MRVATKVLAENQMHVRLSYITAEDILLCARCFRFPEMVDRRQLPVLALIRLWGGRDHAFNQGKSKIASVTRDLLAMRIPP